MRPFPLLAVLSLAGCDVATRNVTEFEFLGEVEALIDARDRCGLYRLVTARPDVLRGSHALAIEFRDFVASSRGECRFGKTVPGEEGGTPRFPNADLVERARNESAGSRDAGGRSDPPPAPSRPGVSDADSRDASSSDQSSTTGVSRTAQPVNGSGASKSGETPGNGQRRSHRPDSASQRDQPQRLDGRDGRSGPGRASRSGEEHRGQGRQGPADQRQTGDNRGRGRGGKE